MFITKLQYMLKQVFYIIALLFTSISISAQDAYHTWLKNKLQTDYNLTQTSEWVLSDNENTTLSNVINYGGTYAVVNISGQAFTKATKATINQGTNPWDAGHLFTNRSSISIGDRCLIALWLKSNDDAGKATILAENITTYDKEAVSEVKVNKEWRLYFIAFEAKQSYAVGKLQLGTQLAWRNQVIEIGGIACLNYKKNVIFNTLPIQLYNGEYDGMQDDAPWRAQAALDIEQNRMANLTVRINSSVSDDFDYTITTEMLQHDFKFGTAVVSNMFNGGSNYNATYEQKLLDLDGKGHGFNEVVFENDLKWPAWESHWLSSQSEIISDANWFLDKGISVRGHNLVWPGWTYSPTDITASKTPGYIINRNRQHIKDILAENKIGKLCNDWDVINEITTNNDYANHFKGSNGYTTGREFYSEIFKLTDSLIPDAKLYLNDYIAIEQADSPTNGIAKWQSYIDEILASNAPIEGIGFQGHFSASPTGIPRVKEVLDDFWNKYGLEAKITEYDINTLAPQTTQEKYMRDILTISFAHPSMKGFIMWGFWDGAHWLGNAPMYKTDWTLKPSGEAFIDQVFRKWWSNEEKTSKANVDNVFRLYKGKHKITITTPGGKVLSANVELNGDDVIDFTLPTVATEETESDQNLKVYPNPADAYIIIEGGDKFTTYTIYDSHGKEVKRGISKSEVIDIEGLDDGIYLIKLRSEGSVGVGRFVVGR